MKKNILIFIILLFASTCVAAGILLNNKGTMQPSFDMMDLGEKIPAFPGAEGFGASTAGGRGGRIIHVTNLNDSGSGSLREAVNAKGPRIVVFDMGGIIELKEEIIVKEPFLTIAGQTAPGDGICLKDNTFTVNSHDVIVRGMRFRPGDESESRQMLDSVKIKGSDDNSVKSIIFDHCSLSWSIDENFSTVGKCNDITVQYCIISEALHNSYHTDGGHSMGMLIGSNGGRISIHHNLLANNYDRNPWIQGGVLFNIVNNVVYNYGTVGTRIAASINDDLPSSGNIIGNYYKVGPVTQFKIDNYAPIGRKGIYVNVDSNLDERSMIFIKNNIDTYYRPIDEGYDWELVYGDTDLRVDELTVPIGNITLESVEKAFDTVLMNAGAITPERDMVDVRAVEDTRQNRGTGLIDSSDDNYPDKPRVVNSQSETGGWPVYSIGEMLIDTDYDGIPDEWERKYSLDPRNAEDADEYSQRGYMWIEEYINSLIPMPFIPTKLDTWNYAPVKDLYVNLQDKKTYDCDEVLKVGNKNGKQNYSFFEFEFAVMEHRNIDRAAIKIYVEKNGENEIDLKLYKVGTDWGKNLLEWKKMKDINDVVAQTNVSRSGVYEFDITDCIKSEQMKTKVFSFAICCDLQNDGLINIVSSEGNMNRPILEVTYDKDYIKLSPTPKPVPTPVPIPDVDVMSPYYNKHMVFTTDDTYVLTDSEADNSSNTKLKAYGSLLEDKVILVKFDVSDVFEEFNSSKDIIKGAKLNLYGLKRGSETKIQIYHINDDSWSEKTVKWSDVYTKKVN
jgi:pectate lyase